MLMGHDEQTLVRAPALLPSAANPTDEAGRSRVAPSTGNCRLARALRVEWLGQMAASLCWIASVFAYGISSSGDWLQLFAASSWLLANIAAAVSVEAN